MSKVKTKIISNVPETLFLYLFLYTIVFFYCSFFSVCVCVCAHLSMHVHVRTCVCVCMRKAGGYFPCLTNQAFPSTICPGKWSIIGSNVQHFYVPLLIKTQKSQGRNDNMQQYMKSLVKDIREQECYCIFKNKKQLFIN